MRLSRNPKAGMVWKDFKSGTSENLHISLTINETKDCSKWLGFVVQVSNGLKGGRMSQSKPP